MLTDNSVHFAVPYTEGKFDGDNDIYVNEHRVTYSFGDDFKTLLDKFMSEYAEDGIEPEEIFGFWVVSVNALNIAELAYVDDFLSDGMTYLCNHIAKKLVNHLSVYDIVK